jgi:thioredoxin 1
MSKFGELIDESVPVLLNFFATWDEECEAIQATLKDVAAAMGDQAKIIQIDFDKNKELIDALKIKTLPTHIIYLNNEMKWRKTGFVDANELVVKIKELSALS